MKRSDWKFREEAEQTDVSQLKDKGTFKGPMTQCSDYHLDKKHFHCTLFIHTKLRMVSLSTKQDLWLEVIAKKKV